MNFVAPETVRFTGDAAPSPRCGSTKHRDEGVAAPVNQGRKCMTRPRIIRLSRLAEPTVSQRQFHLILGFRSSCVARSVTLRRAQGHP